MRAYATQSYNRKCFLYLRAGVEGLSFDKIIGGGSFVFAGTKAPGGSGDSCLATMIVRIE